MANGNHHWELQPKRVRKVIFLDDFTDFYHKQTDEVQEQIRFFSQEIQRETDLQNFYSSAVESEHIIGLEISNDILDGIILAFIDDPKNYILLTILCERDDLEGGIQKSIRIRKDYYNE